jgi:hypothetical protein
LGCHQNYADLKVSSGTTLAQQVQAIALNGIYKSRAPLFEVRCDSFHLVGLADECAYDPALLGKLFGCTSGKQAIEQLF